VFKNRKAGLDRPLKVGGGIQPLLVTVLTPATTCAVGVDFSQNNLLVNTPKELFIYINQFVLINGGILLLITLLS
jgi:hypothetical protein